MTVEFAAYTAARLMKEVRRRRIHFDVAKRIVDRQVERLSQEKIREYFRESDWAIEEWEGLEYFGWI